MGRRSVAGAKAVRIDRETITPVMDMVNKVLGFLLEVAMLAAFLFWGFQQAAPWNMILGRGSRSGGGAVGCIFGPAQLTPFA